MVVNLVNMLQLLLPLMAIFAIGIIGEVQVRKNISSVALWAIKFRVLNTRKPVIIVD